MLSKFTHTIFKNKKSFVETDKNDYRSVKAVQTIKEGELILIEHCIPSENGINGIGNIILRSEKLFNNLYPRTKKAWEESSITDSECAKLATEKATKNCFGKKDGWILGLDISNFNHSTTPNAWLIWTNDVLEDFPMVSCRLVFVYATRTIPIGEEITIWYGNGYFGENVNVEDITPTKPMSREYKEYRDIIQLQYLKKEECKYVMFNHLCIHYGLYMTNDLIGSSPKFVKYFTEVLKKDHNHQNVSDWMRQQFISLSLALEYL